MLLPMGSTTTKEASMPRLAAVRKAHGFTQTELGELVNRTQGAISFYERGTQRPRPAVARKIELLLGQPTDVLLSPTNEEDPG
jgi:transcriptional regulator with XRE-family HTH domain